MPVNAYRAPWKAQHRVPQAPSHLPFITVFAALLATCALILAQLMPTATAADDPAGVIRQGSETTFAASAPAATVTIDTTRLNINDSSDFTFTAHNPDFALGTRPDNDQRAVIYTQPIAAPASDDGVATAPGDAFTLRFPDAAIDQDGQLHDVTITYANLTMKIPPAASAAAGFALSRGDIVYVAAPDAANPTTTVASALDTDITIAVEGAPAGATTLFSTVDLDIVSDTRLKDQSFSESFSVVSGAMSNAYIPESNFLDIQRISEGKGANGLKFTATQADSGTYSSGFASLMDAAGFTLHWWGSGRGTGTTFYSAGIKYWVRTTATGPGTITTRAEDIDGVEHEYGPGQLDFPRTKNAEYTISADEGAQLRSLTIDGEAIDLSALGTAAGATLALEAAGGGSVTLERASDGSGDIILTIENIGATHTIDTVFDPLYTVVYNPGAGTGTMPAQDFVGDEAQNLRTFAFTAPEGARFSHWEASTIPAGASASVPVAKSADGDALFDDGESASDVTDEPGGIVTMTAQYVRDISVTKQWDDAANQDGKRAAASLVLMGANGETLATGTLATNDGSTWAFTDLPYADASGNEISYSVTDTLEGYTPTVTGSMLGGFTITNRHTPEVRSVEITKTWIGDEEYPNLRPQSVRVQLYKARASAPEPVAVGNPITISGSGDTWARTISGLPRFEAGEELTYTAQEITEPPTYTASAEGLALTNTFVPPPTENAVITRSIILVYDEGNGFTSPVLDENGDIRVITQELPVSRTATYNDAGEVVWPEWEAATMPEYPAPAVPGWTPHDTKAPMQSGVTPENLPYDVVLIYEPDPPVSVPTETWGAKNAQQRGTPNFILSSQSTADGSPNRFERYTLLDDDYQPVEQLDVPEGTYTIDTSTGLITFTPARDFLGTATPARARAVDANRRSVVETYTPHVVENTENATVSRTITYTYAGGTQAASAVSQQVTIRRVARVNSSTGALTWGAWSTATMPSVASPAIDGWLADILTVPEAEVSSPESPGNVAVTYSPRGIASRAASSYGGRGEVQTGTPTFTERTPTLPSGAANTIERYALLDSSGAEVARLAVEGGVYTIDAASSAVTFTPADGFTGDPTPVNVRAVDTLGQSAEATYSPHVVDNVESRSVERVITYRFEDGTLVPGLSENPVVQHVTFTRTATVNTATGELTWPAWAPEHLDGFEVPEIEGWAATPSFVEALDLDSPDEEIPGIEVSFIAGDPQLAEGEAQISSEGEAGEAQSAQVQVSISTPTLPDGSPNAIARYMLVDPEGTEVSELAVAGGVYTIDPETGIVTFTPEPGFSGDPAPATIRATDLNGKSVEVEYQPHVAAPPAPAAEPTASASPSPSAGQAGPSFAPPATQRPTTTSPLSSTGASLGGAMLASLMLLAGGVALRRREA